MTCDTLEPFAALWMRLFKTSAGAQAVVATVPAINEERAWVRMSSLRRVWDRIAFFAAA